MNQETKKSFYVWFLGAKECPGLRGEQLVRPILRQLKQKEKQGDPAKVTLQISSRGIKLISETFKHFIPSQALTYVSQGSPPDDDIVSAILLLYNPVTKCPVHLHSYRCDSVHTAEMLRSQLWILMEQADNQRRIRDLEDRLQSQGLSRSFSSNPSLFQTSETGPEASRTNSGGPKSGLSGSREDFQDSNNEGSNQAAKMIPPAKNNSVAKFSIPAASVPKNEQERIARLYDSLAAELRDKLNRNTGPLLFPPKDYDEEPILKKKSSLPPKDHSRQIPEETKLQQDLQRKPDGSSSGPSSGIGSDVEDQTPFPGSQDRSTRLWLKKDQNPSKLSLFQDSRVSGSFPSSARTDPSRSRPRQINPESRIPEPSPQAKEKLAEDFSPFKCSGATPPSWHPLKQTTAEAKKYSELSKHQRFPGLDRDSARLEHHFAAQDVSSANNKKNSKKNQQFSQRDEPVMSRHLEGSRYNQAFFPENQKNKKNHGFLL